MAGSRASLAQHLLRPPPCLHLRLHLPWQKRLAPKRAKAVAELTVAAVVAVVAAEMDAAAETAREPNAVRVKIAQHVAAKATVKVASATA